jgi:hypothetical protein
MPFDQKRSRTGARGTYCGTNTRRSAADHQYIHLINNLNLARWLKDLIRPHGIPFLLTQ